jgi:type I restriction enzyme, S subunit
VQGGWEKNPLGSLLSVQNGYAFSSEHFDKIQGTPLVRIRDLKGGTSTQVRFNGPFDEKFLVKRGDLLVGMDGEFRCYKWNGEPALLNQRVCRLAEFSEKLDQDFLFYGINFYLEEIEKRTPFSTVKHLSASKIRDIEFPFPHINEQRRIVSWIKECMQRVDEINQLQEPLKNEYELLKYSAVSEVVDSMGGEGAKTTIGEIVAGDKTAMRSGPFGSAMKHGEFVDDGNLVVGIANVQENRFSPVRKWMISDEKFAAMKRYQVLPGDVLITIMGTIGRTCVVPKEIGQAITSKHVYRIRFPETINPYFISFLINYDGGVRRQLYGSAVGGVMPGLNATKLRNVEITVPSIETQNQVVDRIEEIHGAIKERSTLQITEEVSQLRSSILNKAFSGEL